MFRLFQRERTPLWIMLYAVCMYCIGLSLRAVSGCLEDLCPRNHLSAWRSVQRFSHLNACLTVGVSDVLWLMRLGLCRNPGGLAVVDI